MSFDILRPNKPAIGSIFSIAIMPIELLPEGDLSYNAHKTKVITALNASNFTKIYFTEDKSSDNSNYNSANIDLINHSIQFFVPQKDEQRILTLKKFANARLVALVTYNTGEKILVGNKTEYLRMQISNPSGDNIISVSGFNITLSGDFSQIPPFYAPEV